MITDNTEICNNFNNYFSTVADNILHENKTPILKSFDKYLTNPTNTSFVFEPCDPLEVYSCINELNPNKGAGPNGIPTKILQLISKFICVPLSKIFNMSILTGVHPDQLKQAHVIPIFKKGSRLLISNYRPISLLSNLNKIFEKILHKRMFTYLDKYNLLYDLQFGFRAKYSTSHALIHMTEKIRQALDAGKVTCGIFIDLQKAFDTVNHNILLKKLHHYGFRGIINKWFQSYLSDRRQKVVINGFESENRLMPNGVPQGSVLGPILFLIYINDLHKCIQHSETYHFADDTNILNISNNYKILQKNVNKDLKAMSCWLIANKISLNKDKTVMIFFRKHDALPTIKIKLHGKLLIPSSEVKYLGVYLDEKLDGIKHSEDLIKKLNRSNGMLAKARHYISEDYLKNVYYATFSSHLMYGCQVWTQKLLSVSNKILKLQKKALRLITFSHHKAPSEPLFKQLGILKFTDNIFLQNCIFVHDYLKGNLPTSFDSCFTRVSDNHPIRTKRANQGMLQIPRSRGVTFGDKSIYRNCIDSWNTFTSEINKLERAKAKNDNITIDLLSFSKNKLKKLIIENFLNSYKKFIPALWFQTNWFASQTLEYNGKITLTKCNRFKAMKVANDGLKIKISWGLPH